MATKNFSQMTTKKLQALLNTASDEDKAAIQAVLDARMQAETPMVQGQAEGQVYIDPDNPPTPEDEARWAAEEAAAAAPKKDRMSDEQRAALAAELREKVVNHKCQVVPFNTAEWVDGVVMGVVEDKRSNKVLFAIKLEDGRRVVKVHDSNLIKIFDEVVERTVTRRTGTIREKVEKTPWTPELMESDIAAVAVNVGKMVSYPDGDQTIEGRIISIVPDKRSQRCLYRIEIPTPTEEDPKAVKYAHKVTTLAELTIAEDFDEAGMALNNKFTERRAKASSKEVLTPETKVLRAEEALKKAEEAFAKAEATLKARQEALKAAKAEYKEYLDAQAPAPQEAETEDPEPLA